MNNLKTKDVFILRDKPKDMPDAIATKATSIFQKQSLYCFTKEELATVIAEAQLHAYNILSPKRKVVRSKCYNYFINLFNETESSLEKESIGCFNEGDQG